MLAPFLSSSPTCRRATAGDVLARVSVQDVRLWGTEASTIGDFTSDAVDFHEAYLYGNMDVMAFRLGAMADAESPRSEPARGVGRCCPRTRTTWSVRAGAEPGLPRRGRR